MSADDKTSGELDPALAARLADPAVWAEPPASLQEQIVAAIAAEKESVRRPRSLWATVLAGAAVLILVLGIVVGVSAMHKNDALTYAASLNGTELAPSATGSVTLTKTTSGWKIRLHADGLPRRADGAYYEAWLKDATGALVPVGTFNSFEDVTLWSGVSPQDHPTFTVTRQLANGDPKSSGEVVLKGVTAKQN
ncbi:MAG: anti-sigma factor [Marmoricola sp.]